MDNGVKCKHHIPEIFVICKVKHLLWIALITVVSVFTFQDGAKKKAIVLQNLTQSIAKVCNDVFTYTKNLSDSHCNVLRSAQSQKQKSKFLKTRDRLKFCSNISLYHDRVTGSVSSKGVCLKDYYKERYYRRRTTTKPSVFRRTDIPQVKTETPVYLPKVQRPSSCLI